MERQYQHLSAEERAVIQIERRSGPSLRSIARSLGRSVSTPSREIVRNEVETEAGERLRYEARTAGMAYRLRRERRVRPRKLVEGEALWQQVGDRLVYDRWSPQHIATRLRTRKSPLTRNVLHLILEPKQGSSPGSLARVRPAREPPGTVLVDPTARIFAARRT